MPFTNTQAESLIRKINSISRHDDEAAVKTLQAIITDLQAINTLDELTLKPDIASQLAVERVAEHLHDRLRQIPSIPARIQPLLSLIQLLFNIHTAEDVNAINAEGRTLLELALAMSDLDTLRILVERYHADVNAVQDNDGNTLLHIKLKQRDYPAARALVEVGRAAVNAQNNSGKTPLHIAAEQGNLQMAQLLIEWGAGVYGNATCLVAEAAEHGHLELMKYLEQKYGVDIVAKDSAMDRRPLVLAAKAGHLKIVKFLEEERGAEIDNWFVEQSLVEQSLVEASRRGDQPAIDFWLKRLQPGAEFRIKGGDHTVLHKAAAGGHVATIEFWLKRGFDINHKEPLGNTPLYYAVKGGHLEAVKWLVARKADVNARNSRNGWGGLILGATQNRQIIDYLMAHGAKIDLQNKDNHRILCLASPELAQFWLGQGLDIHAAYSHFDGYPWHYAARRGDLETLQFWLNRKVDINAQNNWGRSLLYAAADHNHVELVRFLLKQGATADIKNWQEGSNSRAKCEIANLLEDFSVNHEAAEQIHNTVNSLFPGWLSLRNHLPTVLEKIVWGYVGTPQLPVKIVLVEQALRKLAKGMHNRSLVETREVWIQRLEEAKRKIVATIKDPKLKAECNDYWKQLKRKKSLYLNSSSAEYDSVLDAKLDKAFEEIPVPSKTYTPPLASLSTQPKTEVNKAKAEEKEKEMKHTVAADDMMDDEASDTVRAKEPQLSSRSNFSFSSSSSSSCAPQQPAIEYSFPIESKQGLIPFSFAQIIAAEAESRKKVQRVQKGKGASRSINRGTKRERESEKEVEREKDSCETTVALSQNMMGSAVNFFLQAGKKENEGIKQEQSTAQTTEGLQEKEGGSNKKSKKAGGSKNSSVNSFKS